MCSFHHSKAKVNSLCVYFTYVGTVTLRNEVEFLEDFSDTLLASKQIIRLKLEKSGDDYNLVESNFSHDWPLQKYQSGHHTIEIMVRNSSESVHVCSHMHVRYINESY